MSLPHNPQVSTFTSRSSSVRSLTSKLNRFGRCQGSPVTIPKYLNLLIDSDMFGPFRRLIKLSMANIKRRLACCICYSLFNISLSNLIAYRYFPLVFLVFFSTKL